MDSMARKEQILASFSDVDPNRVVIIEKTVDEMVFLEGQLEVLRTYPFIRVHPTDPTLQKQTEASRQYVKLMQSYLQSVKVLSSALNKNILEDEDSPINQWLKSRAEAADD